MKSNNVMDLLPHKSNHIKISENKKSTTRIAVAKLIKKRNLNEKSNDT